LLALESDALHPTCLRLATVYGAAPRMRFDLTVNEFTRDLWAGRDLEVFGEQFWRPYVHARDVATAIRIVLDAPLERVDREVFNVGRSTENFRKLDLVDKIREHVSAGRVRYVTRSDDPRDYKVSFEKIRNDLGFETSMTVSDGIAELVRDLDAGSFGDPPHPGFRHCWPPAARRRGASPSRTSSSARTTSTPWLPRIAPAGSARGRRHARSRRQSRATRARRTRSPCRAARPRCT